LPSPRSSSVGHEPPDSTPIATPATRYAPGSLLPPQPPARANSPSPDKLATGRWPFYAATSAKATCFVSTPPAPSDSDPAAPPTAPAHRGRARSPHRDRPVPTHWRWVPGTAAPRKPRRGAQPRTGNRQTSNRRKSVTSWATRSNTTSASSPVCLRGQAGPEQLACACRDERSAAPFLHRRSPVHAAKARARPWGLAITSVTSGSLTFRGATARQPF
jgi:hypothetical protein